MINTSFKEFNFNFCEIVLNNDCPLNCKYCFLQNQGKRGDYISEQTLTNIFYFIKEYQIINPQPFVKLLFSLKEPLMSWNIIKNVIDNLDFKLIDYQIFITIITNGVLLTEEIYQYCRSHFIDIHISFDGPKDIHDEERIFQKENKSSYEIIMNFIKTHPYKEFLTYAITL